MASECRLASTLLFKTPRVDSKLHSHSRDQFLDMPPKKLFFYIEVPALAVRGPVRARFCVIRLESIFAELRPPARKCTLRNLISNKRPRRWLSTVVKFPHARLLFGITKSLLECTSEGTLFGRDIGENEKYGITSHTVSTAVAVSPTLYRRKKLYVPVANVSGCRGNGPMRGEGGVRI